MTRFTKQLDFRTAMRIAAEHLSYRSLIEEIERDLDAVRAGERELSEHLPALLEGFLAQVRVHFALEERGGLFEVYREHEHLFRKHAAAMAVEHHEFVRRLERSLEEARALTGPADPRFAGWAAELRAIFADLRVHERVEDELLERFVDRSSGMR